MAGLNPRYRRSSVAKKAAHIVQYGPEKIQNRGVWECKFST
jgi:hypothetical protein